MNNTKIQKIALGNGGVVATSGILPDSTLQVDSHPRMQDGY
jgi:hypothetical protein